MQTGELVGIWKLVSNAGKQPTEDGIKLQLIKFNADGTFVDAVESLSPCPGLLPERVRRLKGEWRLNDDILERTFPEGSFTEGTSPEITHKSIIAINSDNLEIAAAQCDRNIQKNYIGIFVYERVNTS
jgi:hypothetical protein